MAGDGPGEPGIGFKKVSQLIADELRGRIARGEMIDGETLPNEKILQEQFSVSRPTLREALRVLEAEGLVTTPRGGSRGARINLPNADHAARYAGLVLQVRGATLTEIFVLRTLIEPTAARLVAERDPRPDLSKLKELAHKIGLARKQPREIARLNRSFDQTLLALSGNEAFKLVGQMMAHIMGMHLESIPEDIDALPLENAQGIDKSRRQLEKIIGLIEAGEGAKVEKLTRARLLENEAHHARRATPSDRFIMHR